MKVIRLTSKGLMGDTLSDVYLNVDAIESFETLGDSTRVRIIGRPEVDPSYSVTESVEQIARMIEEAQEEIGVRSPDSAPPPGSMDSV